MGEGVDRRTLLRRAIGTAVALAAPGGLAGCATYIRPQPRIPGYVLDVAPLPPGLQGLIADRAAHVGIASPTYVTLPNGDSAAQRGAAFGGLTERQGGNFDPVYDDSPRDADLVVVQADAGADAIARTVIAQGVQVVTYLAPLGHQTAQIEIAAGALGALLAADALAWARARRRGAARAVFVTGVPPYGSPAWISTHGSPPPGPPPRVLASADEDAIRAALTGAIQRIEVSTIDFLDDPAGMVATMSGAGIILCGDDTQALEIARTLRRALPAARRREIYVGGLGSPSIGVSGGPPGSGAALAPWIDELRRDSVLRALATVRLRDLADALVDLPAALMRGARPYDIRIQPVLLTPGSAALAQYERDSLR